MNITYFGILLALLMVPSSIVAEETSGDTEVGQIEKRSSFDNFLVPIFIKSERCEDPGAVKCGKASIMVNGREYAPRKTGHNVVVYNPRTARVVAVAFDTLSSRYGSVKLWKLLRGCRGKGLIILVAVQGEGTRGLGPQVRTELEAIGAKGISKDYRSSYALIGWSGPGGVDFVTQVQKDYKQGPSMISKVLFFPRK